MTSIVDTPSAAPRLVDGPARILRWLDQASDRLSPIVVKEVRQIVRGREFNYSFIASLCFALTVAFFGATSAAGGSPAVGRWVFVALTGCLAFLGFVVVPLGAFNALRNERLEQTMDLIIVTSLSARRVVIGKLLAQAVKLATLFAGMAPFIAMSFLLGGIDFLTIVVSLAMVFLGSLLFCATALFASSIPKTRGVFGLMFVAIGITLLLLLGGGRIIALIVFGAIGGGVGWAVTGGGIYGVSSPALGTAGAQNWWMLGVLATLGAASLVNLVLLAENRLSSPIEDKSTALRIGFLVQFLLIAGLFTALWHFGPAVPNVNQPIVVFCGFQLAVVAAFTVTEDLGVSRRVWLQMSAPSRWNWLKAVLRPGGGRGALYVLLQMVVLLAVVRHVDGTFEDIRWAAALCGYVLFLTGVPTVALRYVKPGISSFHLRVAILVALSASMVLPDLLYYVLWRPETFTMAFSARHLFNPLRTLANWNVVEMREWLAMPAVLGKVGLLSYIALIWMGRDVMRRQLREQHAPASHTSEYEKTPV